MEQCICCWDEVNKIWVKVFKATELPPDVLEQIERDKEKAVLLIEAGKY